jgi:hypothetical protein
MSTTLRLIIQLVERGEVRISEHGYDELATDNILIREMVANIPNAIIVEDYPDYHKGPAVLVLQQDSAGNPVHVVWGIPKGASSPAVLVTAYRPDPSRWSGEFTRRKI